MLWPPEPLGRGGWWWAQLVLFLRLAILLALLVLTLVELGEISTHRPATSGPRLLDFEFSRGQVADQSTKIVYMVAVLAFSLLCLLSIWSNIIAEIGRWHDLGMSGFWVLLRFAWSLSWFHMNPQLSAVVIFGIELFRLVCLGFIPGDGAGAPHHQPYQPTPGRFGARQATQPRSSNGGLFALVIIVLLIVGVAGAFKYGFISRKEIQSANTDLLSHTGTSFFSTAGTNFNSYAAFTNFFAYIQKPTNPASGNSDSPLGTSNANFAKDWVIINGEKLTDISAVQPAIHAQVTVSYAEGRRTVPAYTLPQGFLAAWNITSERLKAVNESATESH
jgi:uncharacterized membrane protein YhaH (DUF805 family)